MWVGYEMTAGIYGLNRDGDQINLVKKFQPTILEQKSVLDVGCGSGWLATLVSPNAEYLGIDLNPEGIAIARERYGANNHRYLVVNLFEYKPKHKFDMVISTGMFGGLSSSKSTGDLVKMITNMLKWSNDYVVMVEMDKTVTTIRTTILNQIKGFENCSYETIKTLNTSEGYICCLVIRKGSNKNE